MGFRQTLVTEVIDPTITAPLQLWNEANGESNNTYNSLFSYQTSDAPSGVAYCHRALIADTTDACFFSWRIFRWDAISGLRLSTVIDGDPFGTNLGKKAYRESRDNRLYCGFGGLVGSLFKVVHSDFSITGTRVFPTTPSKLKEIVDPGPARDP